MKNKLTVKEIDVLIEALEAWKTASKRNSLLAGLFLGSMVAGSGDQEAGRDLVQTLMSGENETEAGRTKVADALIEKLRAKRERAEERERGETLDKAIHAAQAAKAANTNIPF